MVVLKNCEPELSQILAEIFNMCLKESCFPGCWKVSSVVPVFKNVGERSTAKNYHTVSLLSVVSKVFEKLVNNRIVSDRIARAFNRSGATVALDISKAFDRGFGMLVVFFTNLAGLLSKWLKEIMKNFNSLIGYFPAEL